MSQLAAEMRPGSGAELLDILEMRGSPRDPLKPGRDLVATDPNATAKEVYEALEASRTVEEGTLQRAKSFFGELGEPITLQKLADRLNAPVIEPSNVSSPFQNYFNRFIFSIPELDFIKYACEELYGETDTKDLAAAGRKWADEIERLVLKLRFERKLDNAGERTLAEVLPHIEALLGKTGEGEPLTGAERDAAFQSLEPAVQKAYLAFQYAETKRGCRLEDRVAYDLLNDEGISTDQGNLGLLADYPLPNFATWARQLRDARNALKEQKHKRRGRRRATRSIVKGDQLENQTGDA